MGCEKNEAEIFHNIESSASITTQLISNAVVAEREPEDRKTLEEIIENYASIVLEPVIGRTRVLAFKIEGNFTGSGNREIIGFYELQSPIFTYAHMETAFLFIIESNNKKIGRIYKINYMTGEFHDKYEANTGLNENLGSYIIWRDRIIGCVGDFNQNGKDELFLFSLSGMNFVPRFYEFNGTEFTEILDLGTWADFVSITAIDPEKKQITLNIKKDVDDPIISLIEVINTYFWDEAVQRYEVLLKETKNYRWNRNLRQYEEIIE